MRRLSPLIVDLYELTMAEAYLRHGPDSLATFDLFVRDLPPERPFLLAVGLGTVLEQIEGLLPVAGLGDVRRHDVADRVADNRSNRAGVVDNQSPLKRIGQQPQSRDGARPR